MTAEPRRLGADFAPRVASGAVLVLAALLAAYLGGWIFALFWAVAFGAVAWEWQRLIGDEGLVARAGLSWAAIALTAIFAQRGSLPTSLATVAVAAAALAFIGARTLAQRAFRAGGMLYAGVPLVATLAVRASPEEGLPAVLWLFAVVWGTDIAAYFVGRFVGGPKLWPSVSPGKTWSGAVGGAVCGAGAGLLLSPWTNDSVVLLALGLAMSLAAQAGDLFESALKRRFGVKDTSGLIPGHGGVMDRLDGFIAATLLAAVVGARNSEGQWLASGLFHW